MCHFGFYIGDKASTSRVTVRPVPRETGRGASRGFFCGIARESFLETEDSGMMGMDIALKGRKTEMEAANVPGYEGIVNVSGCISHGEGD